MQNLQSFAKPWTLNDDNYVKIKYNRKAQKNKTKLNKTKQKKKKKKNTAGFLAIAIWLFIGEVIII